MKYKGKLIPIGGNEDKGNKEEDNQLEYIEEGILSRVLRESGGQDASVVVIPTASSIPDEVSQNYLHAFDRLGCQNVKILDIRNRKQSNMESSLRLLEDADCVMFSGGDQSKITEKIGGTKAHDLLLRKLQNEQFVLAGTSAGAMCMSTEMITGGSSSESLIKGAVGMAQGMNFIPSLVIDSHFIRRGRFGRLAEAVSRFPNLIGVGLAEDTGLVIDDGEWIEVIGSGMVILFDPRKLSYNNTEELSEGSPITLANMRTHVLANGDQFRITKEEVEIIPLKEEFVESN